MEVSTVEQMDTSSSGTSEASAPLPIRQPSGINAGPYKKQAYPMNSKRPEHLRMNLWRSARPRTLALFQFLLLFLFYCFLSKRLVDFFKKLTDTVNADHQLFQQRLPFLCLLGILPTQPDLLSLPQIISSRHLIGQRSGVCCVWEVLFNEKSFRLLAQRCQQMSGLRWFRCTGIIMRIYWCSQVWAVLLVRFLTGYPLHRERECGYKSLYFCLNMPGFLVNGNTVSR